MSDYQVNLFDFSSHSGKGFHEYEEKVKDSAKMQTFVER
jgi:hypothetical protein